MSRTRLLISSHFCKTIPAHAYGHVQGERLEEALAYFLRQSDLAGWPYAGNLRENWLLPTAAGSVRRTCLAPGSMVAGDLRQAQSLLLVGFRQLRDFYPEYAAANLARSQGMEARGVYLDVPALQGRDNITPVELARSFDQSGLRTQVIRALKPLLGRWQRIGFPAVLGLRDPRSLARYLHRGGPPLI